MNHNSNSSTSTAPSKRKAVPKNHVHTQSSQKRKKPFIRWEPLSQFLDASCSITPATFAARRLPEIKSLWRSHLYHEWEKTGSRTGGGTSHHLEMVWKSGGKKISDRHLRRRTGSFDPKRYHRDFHDNPPINHSPKNPNDETKRCRRARRKPALLRQIHMNYNHHRHLPFTTPSSTSLSSSSSSPSSPSSSSTSNSSLPAYWLPTHYWHTKRFHMFPLFHWSLPLVHTNRGITPSLRYHVTLQDSTYRTAHPLEIRWHPPNSSNLHPPSPMDHNVYRKALHHLLLHILSPICGPSPYGSSSMLDHEFLCKSNKPIMSDVVLYSPHAYPSHPIGPAQLFFSHPNHSHHGPHGKKDAKTHSYTSPSMVILFVHPSIRSRTKEALEQLISQFHHDHHHHKTETTTKEDSSISFQLVDGTPKALLCVRGNHATTCIMNALSPILQDQDNDYDIPNDSHINNEIDGDADADADGDAMENNHHRIWNEMQRKASTYNNQKESNINDLELRSKFIHGHVLNVRIDRRDKHNSFWNSDFIEQTKIENAHLQMENIKQSIQCLLISQSPNYLHDKHAYKTTSHNNNNTHNNHSKKKNMQNSRVSGWDILLEPKHASTIFQILNHHGARVIGLMEEAAAQLEADPPLPLFPRDYPDTTEGQLYWNPSNFHLNPSSNDKEEEQNQKDQDGISDWNVLKFLWEQDKDRCGTWIKRLRNLRNKKPFNHHKCKNVENHSNGSPLPNTTASAETLSSVSCAVTKPNIQFSRKHINLWKHLVSITHDTSMDTSHCHLVVVRGVAHGDPFLQALGNSASASATVILPQQQQNNTNVDSDSISNSCHDKYKRKRRPRRKVVNPYHPKWAPPLPSKDHIHHHVTICQNLLSTLSLPALLRCSIVIVGKGTLQPCAMILECRNDIHMANEGNDIPFHSETNVSNHEKNNLPTTQQDNPSIEDKRNVTATTLLVHHPANAILGYAVAGSFSSTRGTYIGTGFVSAARFLQAVIRACQFKQNLVIVNTNGYQTNTHTLTLENQHNVVSRRIDLVVNIKNPSSTSLMRKGILSLLF